MKKFKIPFVKCQYVRGFKIFTGNTKDEALNKADKAMMDPKKPLQTTDVTWGEPQYEEDSFEIEAGDGSAEDTNLFVEEV